jgi:hypothetical protein
VVLVKLDPEKPRAFYLAGLHTTCGDYWEETQASITSDGSSVVWASNWNKNVGKGELFVMELFCPAVYPN